MRKFDYTKSLSYTHPKIASEWHPTKNGVLCPEDVLPGSNKKVWWICPNGHEYESMIAKHALMGRNCPYCSNHKVLQGYNDFASQHPSLLRYWDYEKNVDLLPAQVVSGTDKKVWWKCEKGHSYEMRINAKVRGAGCSICLSQVLSDDNCLATTEPWLAAEWHPTKNGNLTPKDVMRASHVKVWWKCANGHEWQAPPYSRLIHGCPICDSEKRTSFPEQAIRYYLNKLFPAESRSNIGGFEADIYCPSYKLAIEYDGAYFHSGEDNLDREECKNRFFTEQGILLFRIKETKNHIDFKCQGTSYGYEITIHYSQDYAFVAKVISEILDVICEKYGKQYYLDIDLVRDKVEIINLYAQQKDCDSFIQQKPLGAQKWNAEKNGEIDLRLLPKTSKKKYWWKCPTCGNEWYGALDNIVISLTCNKCSRQVKAEYDVAPETQMDSSAFFRELPKNLLTENPDLASQWHPTKNGFFIPIHVAPKSGKRVWWVCPACGFEWTQMIKTRNNGKTARMCPRCANNQKKEVSDSIKPFLPILYKEWHPTKNGDKQLDDYTPGSNVKVWWKCSICGNEYCCSIKSRRVGGGCTVCGIEQSSIAKFKKIRNIDTDEVFKSVKEAALKTGINRCSISNCLTGKSKTAGGFRWEYMETKLY